MVSNAANAGAVTTKGFFGQCTEVSIHMDAPAQKVWELLTDVARFPSWNSTVVEMTGHVSLGGSIALRSTLAPRRTFKLKVKAFEPPTRLSWGDAMGTRVFVLASAEGGGTRFSMSECISGLLFPLFSRLIPPLDASFNQFAADLKKSRRGVNGMNDYRVAVGTKERPLSLKTPPGAASYTMHVEEKGGVEVLVCTVGSTVLHYDLRSIEDLAAMLKEHGQWMPLGSKDEKQETEDGTVEHWARSVSNPIGGWYGLKKGFRGRFAMYMPPLLEHLGLAEVEHKARDNRMRCKL